jgi:hypothetical protein
MATASWQQQGKQTTHANNAIAVADTWLVIGAGLLVLGTGTGRGTYLCPRENCVAQALRKSSIPRRLRATVEIPSGLAASVIAALPGGRNPHG